MIAIKIKQDIKSGRLVIPELEKYKGNSEEIIRGTQGDIIERITIK